MTLNIADTLEEIVCEGEEKAINCTSHGEVLRIIPGTYYGEANIHTCGGASSIKLNNCRDSEAYKEAAALYV